MRIHYYLLLLCIGIFSLSCGGGKQLARNAPYPDRYRVELPKSWKFRTKIIRAVTDILPATAPVLSDKKYCGDCKGGYVAKLYIGDPEIDRYKSTASATVFRFKAYFTIYDPKDSAVMRVHIVHPETDVFTLSITDSGPAALSIGTTEEGRRQLEINMSGGGDPSPAHNNGKVYGIRPSVQKLMEYTEHKLYDIRKILQELEISKSG